MATLLDFAILKSFSLVSDKIISIKQGIYHNGFALLKTIHHLPFDLLSSKLFFFLLFLIS